MLWMITKDLINVGDVINQVGRCGDELAASLDATKVPEAMRISIVADCDYEFRLYDDDGNLYFEGVCKELENQDGDSAFEPLDHFINSEGCTRMDYRKKDGGDWATL